MRQHARLCEPVCLLTVPVGCFGSDPRHSVIHSIFVGVTIEGGYTGPGLYTRTDTAVAHRLSRGRQRDNVTGVHRSI